MKLSDAIAIYLLKRGVNCIFGYQGGSITHMIDSFDKYGIKYIQSYNEQGAGFAANAYARINSDAIGVAIGTNGPGATNLITAIADAYCDSQPVLFFTGQVHTFAMKKSEDIRQESFQEIDIIPMVKPITKYAKTVLDKNAAIDEIDKAINIALDGRKGPVVIDLPVDVQGMDIDFDVDGYSIAKSEICSQCLGLQNIVEDFLNAKRPLILAGGGIRTSDTVELFREFVRDAGIPVVTSLMGLDVLPHDDNNFIGFIGSYGNRYANYAVQNADIILVLGSRLDMRQTGKRKDLFAPKAKIIHIDVDQSELGHFIKEETKINMDLRDFFNGISNIDFHLNIDDWKNQISIWKDKFSDTDEFDESKEINPNLFIRNISEYIPNNSIVTSDVGQNQMWIAQSLRINGDDVRILNSGGLGSMGFSLPASIGAYFAKPDKVHIAFMGDGGLQMNIQELQMVSNYKIPLKVIVFKNDALGLIRDVHEKYYGNRCVGSIDGFSVPPLDKISCAYNMKYKKIDNCFNTNELINIFADGNSWLIEVLLNDKTYVRPELLGPDGIDNQSPYVKGS